MGWQEGRGTAVVMPGETIVLVCCWDSESWEALEGTGSFESEGQHQMRVQGGRVLRSREEMCVWGDGERGREREAGRRIPAREEGPFEKKSKMGLDSGGEGWGSRGPCELGIGCVSQGVQDKGPGLLLGWEWLRC